MRAGAWARVEGWIPEVSDVSVATDRRVRCVADGERCLKAERTLRVRRALGGGRVWSVRRRVADARRNISLLGEAGGRGA